MYAQKHKYEVKLWEEGDPENKNDAKTKSLPDDLQFSHVVRMDKTNLQTKSQPIWKIFTDLEEFGNFGICKFSHSVFRKNFDLQFRKLSYDLNHVIFSCT